VPVIAAVAGSDHPDRELVELGREYLRLNAAEDAADEQCARSRKALTEPNVLRVARCIKLAFLRRNAMLVRPQDLADRMSGMRQPEDFRLPIDAARWCARPLR
jgi:hypothetical protein